MIILLNFLILAASIVGLWLGAQWLVESATRVARRLRVSELAIGLTIVALGTSLPELAVSIGATLAGRGALSPETLRQRAGAALACRDT